MMMIIPNLSERKRVLCDDDVVHHVDHPVGGHLVMLIIVIIMTMMLMVDHSVGQHGRHDFTMVTKLTMRMISIH